MAKPGLSRGAFDAGLHGHEVRARRRPQCSCTAAHAGLSPALISVIGADLAWIRTDSRLAALDLTGVKVAPGRSCAFTLTYTAAGSLARIDCSFGAAEALTGHCLSAIGHHGQYHVCCRRPLDVPAVLSRMAHAGLTYSVDFHLASAQHMIAASVPFLAQATAVFVNAAEFAALRARIDPGQLAVVVVSDGARETTLLRYGQVTASIQPPVTSAAEVTGAGDILAGTFLAGVRSGASDSDVLRAAVDAASRSMREPGLVISGS